MNHSALASRSARELVELQLKLECIGVEDANTLVRIPGADPDDIARFYVVQYDGAYRVYFRQDLPVPIRERLAALPLRQAFSDRERVKAILAPDAPCRETWIGTSYVFPTTPMGHLYPDAVRLDGTTHRALLERYGRWMDAAGKTVYGIVVAGRIVASCGSARENSRSAEAWVTTEPRFRRRGYARQVTAAWAHDLQRQGKVAFYSHAQDNRASEAVARSLGLIRFSEAVAYL